MDDTISRQAVITEIASMPIIIDENGEKLIDKTCLRIKIKAIPPEQPEYKPVTAEDFAKIMSENTIYSFIAWHSEALELMERHGFVICKKTM